MNKKRVILFIWLVFIMVTAITAYGEEELIWSNFNSDPVESQPDYYSSFPVSEDQAPILITRIRTYHWNDGKGAEPGEICAYYDDSMEEIECWQAVGRAEDGVQNVYWEALTDFIMLPGKSYGFLVSDYESWSYNEASDESGMIELYGEDPAPESYEIPVEITLENITEQTTEIDRGVWVQDYSSYTIPANPAVGQILTFGHYEQDNIPENGDEPVEWQVLTVQKDRALLLSRYALDFRAMNDYFTEMTWETSGMRQWLNSEFYNRAFTDTEKSQILSVINDNPDNIQFGTEGGNVTEDRVFLLSYDELMNYLKDGYRSCGVTEFARAQSQYLASQKIYDYAGMMNREFAIWWLRTPGMAPGYFMTVSTDANLSGNGPFALDFHSGDISYDDVRPALWVRVSSSPTTVNPIFHIRPIRRRVPCFNVFYEGKNCLSRTPVDRRCYRPGEFVKIQFGKEIPGKIFDGWDWNRNGSVDFNKSHLFFRMPWWNVKLIAICHSNLTPTPTPTPVVTKNPVITSTTKPVVRVTPTPTPTQIPQPPCYRVNYVGNGCLSAVPTDNRCYRPGETVTVLFSPVQYVQGLIFNGWNMSGSGIAEFGYYYNTFTMPARNVTLSAICNAYIPPAPEPPVREQPIIDENWPWQNEYIDENNYQWDQNYWEYYDPFFYDLIVPDQQYYAAPIYR